MRGRMTDPGARSLPRRRSFLRSAAACALASCCMPWTRPAWAGGFDLSDRTGLGLYMLQRLLDDNIDNTLRTVAEIGYTELEIPYYYFTTPPSLLRLRASLERHGLRRPAGRFLFRDLYANPFQAIETALIVGHDYIVCQGAPSDLAGQDLEVIERFSRRLNYIGEKCRAVGLKFVLHNHDWEFSPTGGTRPYDVMLQVLDPELVNMQLCLYWTAVADVDPVGLFAAHPGRFPLWHVRDMAGTPDKRDVDLGTGVIDFARIFSHARQAGLRHFFVDQEPSHDLIRSITVARAYLAAL